MKFFVYIIFLSMFLLGVNPLNAQEETEEEEISTFTNQTQVQRAENLAEVSQALSADAVVDAQESVNSTQSEYEDAKVALELDPENVDLQDALSLAEKNLDDATVSLANASGATVESISEMRASGMGWGDIAHELGIHPSVLGLGHTKKSISQERVRSTKSFRTNTPGTNNGNGKSQGLKGKASSSSSKGNGNSGGKGNGNSGGNGK